MDNVTEVVEVIDVAEVELVGEASSTRRGCRCRTRIGVEVGEDYDEGDSPAESRRVEDAG